MLDLIDLLAAHPAGSHEAATPSGPGNRALGGSAVRSRLNPVQLDVFRVLCHGLGYPELCRDLVQTAYSGEEPVVSPMAIYTPGWLVRPSPFTR